VRQVEEETMAEIALLTRPSLHDEIVGALRAMIVAGDLRAGAWVAEPALCRRLEISRTPLREALKVLAFDGWVELVPNRGAVVTRITPDEVASLFELLEGLEQFIGELAADRATVADFREIRALHDIMVGHYESGDPTAYFTVNQQIHHRLAQATRNPALVATHENLSRKVLRARAMANLLTDRQDASFSEHAAILASLEQRDGALLGRLLRAHLHDAGEAVRTALIRRSRPAAPRKSIARRLRA
jgi:DNA-binding GntR family transcriptional regulator